MWARIQRLMFVLLVLSACERPDDVLPVPHRYEQATPPASPEQFENEVKQPVPADTDVFKYGHFGDMPYRFLTPRDYDSTQAYPLHVFLHGIGERGRDNEKQLAVGGSYFQEDSIRTSYPAFVVFPQCDESDYWFDTGVMKKLKALIDLFVRSYNIDTDAISIGGFSMGAYGSFAMVAAYPDLFETALAISGDGDERKAKLMAKPDWEIFAGQYDHVVPSGRTKKMADALKRAGASVSYKLYPDGDHRTTWVKAFSEPDFFRRLFRPVKAK